MTVPVPPAVSIPHVVEGGPMPLGPPKIPTNSPPKVEAEVAKFNPA